MYATIWSGVEEYSSLLARLLLSLLLLLLRLCIGKISKNPVAWVQSLVFIIRIYQIVITAPCHVLLGFRIIIVAVTGRVIINLC